MLWLWIILSIVGALALFLVVMYLIGRSMDEKHSISCAIRLRQAPEAVFAAIDEVLGWPEWDPGVASVTRLPDDNGREACRMMIGRNPMELVTTRREPPRLLERTIRDTGKHQMFSGSWRHEITPADQGCLVRLTEDGAIHMALPRAMARLLADPAMYLKRHLRRLATKFGEEARFE